MKARLKLKPGQKGTKGLVDKYGDALLCVRYRYDEATRTRLKTVEIIVEKKEWTPPQPIFAINALVPVRIAFTESHLKNMQRQQAGDRTRKRNCNSSPLAGSKAPFWKSI